MSSLKKCLLKKQSPHPEEIINGLTGEKKKSYFAAIQAGLDKGYVPIETLFEEIIEQS